MLSPPCREPDCVLDSWSLKLRESYEDCLADLDMTAFMAGESVCKVEAWHVSVRRSLLAARLQTHAGFSKSKGGTNEFFARDGFRRQRWDGKEEAKRREPGGALRARRAFPHPESRHTCYSVWDAFGPHALAMSPRVISFECYSLYTSKLLVLWIRTCLLCLYRSEVKHTSELLCDLCV